MKKIILAVAVAAVAIMGVAGSALAGGGTGITATSAARRRGRVTLPRSSARRAESSPRRTGSTWTRPVLRTRGRALTCISSSVPRLVPTTPAARRRTRRATRPVSSRSCPTRTTRSRTRPIAGTPASGYFINGNPYNACVYLVNPQVASGTINSAEIDGTTAPLPNGLAGGHFRINVSGEYVNIGKEHRRCRVHGRSSTGRRRCRATTLIRGPSEKASGTCRSTVTSWTGAPLVRRTITASPRRSLVP